MTTQNLQLQYCIRLFFKSLAQFVAKISYMSLFSVICLNPYVECSWFILYKKDTWENVNAAKIVCLFFLLVCEKLKKDHL